MVAGCASAESGFTSLHENLDTTTPGGRLVFHVFAALAEFIRSQGAAHRIDPTVSRYGILRATGHLVRRGPDAVLSTGGYAAVALLSSSTRNWARV
ncbi:hypothetical protein ACIOEW_19930 [Streptomyces sp. NPDC087901]|uniref:hypothetical protein n=1 Tax=unclassified Streptomyces TaxID=2593676 RepID=UPI00344A5303